MGAAILEGRFLLWWILNVARARCRVEFLSSSNRPELFVLVTPLHCIDYFTRVSVKERGNRYILAGQDLEM